MNLLQNILSGGPQRDDYDDFVQRYEQGHPAEGYSDEEVVNRYQQVSELASPEVYQQSAEEAFARLSPGEREEFAVHLQQQAQQQGVQLPGGAQGASMQGFQDPGQLAQITSQLHQEQPGMLGQLLGGGGGSGGLGGMLGNPIAKAALAGITAMAAKRFMGR
jgi:hypothetical protein